MFSVESSSEAAYTGASPNAYGILAMKSPTVQAIKASSPPTSFHLSPLPSTGGPPTPTSTVFGDGPRYGSGDQRVRWGLPPSRFFLYLTHRYDHCQIVPEASLRSQLVATRKANYHKLHTRQWLRLGSQFSRPQGPFWRVNSSSQAALINLVDGEADGAGNLAVEE